MEEHRLWITVLVNKLLGKAVAALLAALGMHPQNPQYPIPNHIAMEMVVFVVAVVFFLWLKRRLSVERPGAVQQCLEMFVTNPMGVGVRDLLEDIVGHGSQKYMAMLGSIGMFVLLSNLIGLIPGFESPTATVSVPLGCAVAVFLYYNWCGVRKHGALGYGKHFTGPEMPLPFPANLVMSLFMLVVETISNLARLLSLTVRLWVNIFVSEILYVIFLGLTMLLFLFVKERAVVGYVLAVVPLVAPLAFMALHLFVALLQAFVFTLLPVIYVSGAVAEEH